MPRTPLQRTPPAKISRYARIWRRFASNLGLMRNSFGRHDPAFRISFERPGRGRLLPEGLVRRTCINTTGAQKGQQQVNLNLLNREVARLSRFAAIGRWALPGRSTSNLRWYGSGLPLSGWTMNRGQPVRSGRNCSECLAGPQGCESNSECWSV